MDDCSPVVVAARRTPFGTAGQALRDVPVEQLAAPVLRAVLADAGARTDEVDEVVLGNVMGPGGNPARVAALAAGFGPTVTGLTIDRQCGSGLEAVTLAATLVRAGRAGLVLAGGAESASTAPARIHRGRDGAPAHEYTRAPFAPHGHDDPEMGQAADRLARAAGVTRERQDRYAAASHARAVAAAAAGRFAAELVPVGGLDRDQRPRPGRTPERLGRLPAAFTVGGTATAGNSCGISDGAAAVAVVPERLRAGRPGLRILDWECSGVAAGEPGFGPVPAVRRLLERTGVGVGDLGVVEFTEAFAGQVLACLDALDLDPDRVCPDGGAIALGHPWGASGAALIVRLFTAQVRAGGPRWGLATCGIGGGMGLAVLLERVGA